MQCLFWLWDIWLYSKADTTISIKLSSISCTKQLIETCSLLLLRCKPQHWKWNCNWYYNHHYLHFNKAYGPKPLEGGDLRWGDSTHKFKWLTDNVVTWQIKNVISPHSQGLWLPKLGKVLTQHERVPSKNSHDPSILW